VQTLCVLMKHLKFSSCIGSFLENNIVVQKSICVFDDDGIVVWKDLTPLNINNPII